MAVLKGIWEYICARWLPSQRTYTFEERFRQARDLLDFAITEGSNIDDGVIDQIDGAELETVDRVQFDKAYRKLVEAVSPVTWSSLRFSSMSKWKLLGIAVILTALICTILGTNGFPEVLGTAVGLFALIWFLDIFTGIVTKKRMIEIIVLCYLFTFAAVIGPLVMFFGVFSWYPQVQEAMKENPVGLLRGCSSQRRAGWVPEEIECGKPGNTVLSQWVFNIGGTVVAAGKGMREQPGSLINAETGSAAKGKDSTDLSDQRAKAKSDTDKIPRQEKTQALHAVIEGGIVVPLYVIVLALMGGAVSMTRRVPEYQRRVYLLASDAEYISRERGRELLVFQIMQVLSAPLIVIAAYYTIKPTDITVSVLLGFSSGFASETILLAIRALVTKLNPIAAPKSQPKPKDA